MINKRLLNVNQININESPVNKTDVVDLATLNYVISQILALTTFEEEILEFDVGASQSLWNPWVLKMFAGLNDSNYFKVGCGTTPSSNTGPSSLPPMGNYDCFIESSTPHFGSGKFAMARRDLPEVKSIYFYYNRNGADMCNFRVEYFNGVDWITELTLTENSGNDWIEKTVIFPEYNSIKSISLVWEEALNYRSDMAISNILISYY